MLYHYIDTPEAHIICRLKEAGLNLKILCHPESTNLDIVEACGIEPIKFAFPNRVSLSATRKILSLVKSFEPQIIHAYSGKAISNSVIASYFMSDRPKIIAYRGAIGNISKFDPSYWTTFLNSKVDKITCVSKYIEQGMLESGIPANRVCTIYKGHDPNWYKANNPKSKKDLDIPEDAFVVGSIANFRRNKGIDLLIDAAKSLSKDLYNLHLVLIGKVHDQSLYKQAEQSGISDRIHFLGFKDNPSEYLPMFDVFVMPSRIREGFAKSVVEAMCCELPCIISNVGGMPELIRDGVDGLIFPEEDSRALAKAILKLAEDPEFRASFGKSGAARIAGEFSVDKTMREIIELYKLFSF